MNIPLVLFIALITMIIIGIPTTVICLSQGNKISDVGAFLGIAALAATFIGSVGIVSMVLAKLLGFY